MIVVGANWHGAWTLQSNATTRGTILDRIKSMGATSVRLDYAWAAIEATKGVYTWTQLDTLINDAYTRGMTVLVMLYWPPQWSSGSTSKAAVPGSAADYGNILGRIGARYGNKLAGVEMWNEPDLSGFWLGTRAQFVDLLADAYPVAKALAPSTTFIAAAPTYLGLATNWFSDMYADSRYRPGISYDAQAIHPYQSASDLPADAASSNYTINGIPLLKTLRASKGDNSPLWATEFGWSTHTNEMYNRATEPWKMGVSEQQHADYTVQAYSLLQGHGVVAAYVYTDMNISTEPDAHEQNFGLLYSDQSKKPVVDAMAAVYAGPTGGAPGTLKIGSANPTKLMVGTVAALKAYMGNSLVWTAPATAPVGKYNSFSGIASGTPLTALNSASGGDAFDLVETSSGTITVNTSADLTNKYTQGIVCHGTASNGYARARWNVPSSTDGYFRFYMRTHTANSNATIRFIRAFPTVAGPAASWELRLDNATNKILMTDSGGVPFLQTQSALAYNTIYRIEGKIRADYSQCELRVFPGESTTALTSAPYYTGATNIPAWNAITFGYTIGSTLATWDPNLAAVAWSAADWIGPAV